MARKVAPPSKKEAGLLLKAKALAGIADGSIRDLYRRWDKPRVKVGSTQRTSIGVLEVEGIETVSLAGLSERHARRAGHESRASLVAELRGHGKGRLYRITLRLAGEDPRVALRERTRLSKAELAALRTKIESLGARSGAGPWGVAILRLIGTNPGVRAPDLAPRVGMEKKHFKPRVRQLKELGLTVSLKVGYRLSPRGREVLRRL